MSPFLGRPTLVTGCRVVESGAQERTGAPSAVEAAVRQCTRLVESLDAATPAAWARGEPAQSVAPRIERIEARITAAAAAVRDDDVPLSELTDAGPLIRTACVQGAEQLPSYAQRLEEVWAAWAAITLSHPTYEAVRRSRNDHRPWNLQDLLHAAESIGAETETPPDIVLDCFLGNHPLPFGPSDDQELRLDRHGYAHTPSSAAGAALSALELADGDVFYDLGSGLGGPTMMAALGSRARCRGIEVHAAYVDRAQTTALALGLREDLFVAADALEHDWSDGNAFYLFNPFPPPVLRQVCERLRRIGRQREVRVACFHTRLGEGFAATARHGAVTVYRTMDGDGRC